MTLQKALDKIDSITKESLNNEQKKIAKEIITKTSINNEADDNVLKFILSNIKLGFVFDSAPEVVQDNVAIINEYKNLNINIQRERESSKQESINNKVEHTLIIGENYEALRNLKLAYIQNINGKTQGLIDVIYIDPPYNTEKTKEDGNDYKQEVKSEKFIYRDKFKRTGWLNMMNERLLLAKDLLIETGVIFISIDDNEQAYLKVLCDEIFGEENFVNDFCWINNLKGRQISKCGAVKTYEHILCYSKNSFNLDTFQVQLDYVKEIMPSIYKMSDYEIMNDSKGSFVIKNELYNTNSAFNEKTRKSLVFDIYYNPVTKQIKTEDVSSKTIEGFIKICPHKNSNGTHKYHAWRWSREKIKNDYEDLYFLVEGTNCRIYTKIRDLNTTSFKDSIMISGNGASEFKKIMSKSIFAFPKPSLLIKLLLKTISNRNSIILDFFAGSGTTAQAVMELNQEDDGKRKFILVTNNENNIAEDITWERIYRVINGEGSKNEKIEWKYSNNIKSLENNSLRVFDIKHYKCSINTDPQKLIDIAKKEISKLNSTFNLKDEVSICNDLSSLHPYEKYQSEEK